MWKYFDFSFLPRNVCLFHLSSRTYTHTRRRRIRSKTKHKIACCLSNGERDAPWVTLDPETFFYFVFLQMKKKRDSPRHATHSVFDYLFRSRGYCWIEVWIIQCAPHGGGGGVDRPLAAAVKRQRCAAKSSCALFKAQQNAADPIFSLESNQIVTRIEFSLTRVMV